MDVIQTIRKIFADCIEQNKIFTYESEHIKAVAIIHGMKHDKINDLKSLLRKLGYEYSYTYNCYLFNPNECCGIETYREEKNTFLENLISWKFGKPIDNEEFVVGKK